MAQCYHRKVAYLTTPRDLFEKPRLLFKRPSCPHRVVSVPCGKCVACRVNNAASWATRAMHEAAYCEGGCFITLTYSPEHCPKDYQLRKGDLQDFLKRLRRAIDYHGKGVIRAFFAVGEYGEKFGRPHYHLLILGWSPDDLVFHGVSYHGDKIYTSAFLERVWARGFCPVGSVTGGSAAYVARYSKKASAPNHGRRTPPFFTASRNIPLTNGKQGALGAQWVVDHHKDLRLGYVHHPCKSGVKCRIPDYYFDLLERWYPEEFRILKCLRFDFAMGKTGGCLFVDNPYTHEPAMWCEDVDGLTEAEKKELREFCGSDDDLQDGRSLIERCNDVLRRAEQAQLRSLLKLRRNME